MIKITNNNDGGVATLKVEGKLTGEWVNELRSCWQQAKIIWEGRAIRIDLTGVTWVNDEGKALLSAMHRSGAKLLAANLLMAGVLAEICSETTE